MKISEQSVILLDADTSNFYKSKQVCKMIEEESILFCNWVNENGWYYGVNGNYHYQSMICKHTELTPQELYEFYKNELKK